VNNADSCQFNPKKIQKHRLGRRIATTLHYFTLWKFVEAKQGPPYVELMFLHGLVIVVSMEQANYGGQF
jgi:hypothetical protein